MSLHVLVISDNGSFAQYLCELLQAAGHSALSVVDGRHAYRAIRQERPGVIIVSVEPAKIPGLAVEQRLHAPDGTRNIPVIVISECTRLESELLQIYDFIPKPLDANRLLADVAAIAQSPEPTAPSAPMTRKQYLEFASYILSCTGLHFENRNRSALERGVERRMSALRINSCSEYLAYLQRHGEDRHELQKLLQFLTVGETYFFRYPAQFAALRERLASQYAFSPAPIRIWSAGCSTGEEPYSIAISIMEALPDWRNRDIKVIATDINNRSLKRAREGVYTPWSMRIAEQHYQQRYFTRVGDSFIIRDEVKRLVEFSHLNLSLPEGAAACGELRELDAIFCRNVLIYFPPEPATRLVSNFAATLKSSGLLFLGHAETLLHRCSGLEIRRQHNSFYYVKKHTRQRGTQPDQFCSLAQTGEPVPEIEPERLGAALQAGSPAQGALSGAARRPGQPGETAVCGHLVGCGYPRQSGQPAQPEHPTLAASAVGGADQAPALSSAPTRQAGAGSSEPQGAVLAVLPAPAPPPTSDLESTAARLEAARLLFEAEDFNGAQKLLAPLVDCPEEPAALVLSGFILAGKGLFQEALDLCGRAIELNDLLPEAYYLKGTILDANDRLYEAAEEYRKALLLDHDFIMPRFHMGQLHLRLGRLPEAAREIRNSIRILSRRGDEGTIPYSGGLTRAVCMVQLQNALAQVA